MRSKTKRLGGLRAAAVVASATILLAGAGTALAADDVEPFRADFPDDRVGRYASSMKYGAEALLAGQEITEGEVKYVSDLQWESLAYPYGTPMRDFRSLGNIDKNEYKMKIAGEQFDKGVGTHVPAELKLNTAGKCSQFISYVGVDDSGDGGAAGAHYSRWIVEGTYADGHTEVLATVGTAKGDVASLIDVNIEGVETLSIWAALKDKDSNNGGSFANLAEAQLNCTDQPIAKSPRVMSKTELNRLSPGAEVRFEIYDAKPQTDIVVRLGDQELGRTAARDEGPSELTVVVPTGISVEDVVFKVSAQNSLGAQYEVDFYGHVVVPVTGTVHVDCSASENGDGSLASPFNTLTPVNQMGSKGFGPGSQILFKRGATCEGQLLIHGSGDATSQNVIGAYGDGDERPILNGAGWTNAIELVDASYWTIQGLKVTNPGQLGLERQGIMVRSLSEAPKAGIVIDDNIIDEVAGWTNKEGNDSRYRNSAGIVIMADHDLPGPNPGLTDGITITNNEISNAGGGGIKLQGDGQLKAGKFHENVYVAHNDIHEVGGDAIVIHATDSAVIEHNRAIDVGHGTYSFDKGNFAGIWGMTSKELLFRYNVVGNSTATTYDSTAWDCDWGMTGESCTFEYNYSYNNAGGAYLDCISGCVNNATNTEAILRYNVMQDDCRLGGASGGPAHTKIYNNVFYCPTRTFVDDMSGPRTMYNNIFVAKSANWDGKTNSYNERFYENNAYFGGIQPHERETGAIVDQDPGLLAPGSAATLLEAGSFLDHLEGYKLVEGSPLLGAGVDLDSFAGEDVFGNATDTPHNIGIHEGDPVEARPLAWREALNTTSIAHETNLRTGAVDFTNTAQASIGQGRVSFLASELNVTSGEEVVVGNDFTFTWDPVRAGTPDSVKATGQEIAVNEGGERLWFVGFSVGDSQGGTATVNYADGTSEEIGMELPNWRESTDEAEVVASAPKYNAHTASYLGSVSTKTGENYVYARSVPLNNESEVSSVVLPAGSPVIGEGLTLFALGVTGEMAEPPVQYDPTLTLSSTEAQPGDVLDVSGEGWEPESEVTVQLVGVARAGAPAVDLGVLQADANGLISGQVTIPEDTAAGSYLVEASADQGGSTLTAAASLVVTAPSPGGEPGGTPGGEPGQQSGETPGGKPGASETLPVTGPVVGSLLVAALALGGLGVEMRRRSRLIGK